MSLFGLESADIAFLGLISGILSAILVPLTYFLINIAKKIAILVDYVTSHEIKSDKESEELDKVVVRLAVVETRIKILERLSMNIKRMGAMNLGEDNNGD